jgi:hypothetical protein
VKPSALSDPSTTTFRVLKWVKVSQTEAEEAEEEAATEDVLGTMDAAETTTQTPTPNAGTPSARTPGGVAGAPPVSQNNNNGNSSRHPLSNALSAPASPRPWSASATATRSPSAAPIPPDSAKNAFPLGATNPSKPSEISASEATGEVVPLGNQDVDMAGGP